MTIKQNFADRLAGYIERLEGIREVHYREEDPNQIAPPVNVKLGRKYVKVTIGSSIHTFISMENGDIHRASTGGSPQPNSVRGNIYDPDCGINCVGPFCTLSIKKSSNRGWLFAKRTGMKK